MELDSGGGPDQGGASWRSAALSGRRTIIAVAIAVFIGLGFGVVTAVVGIETVVAVGQMMVPSRHWPLPTLSGLERDAALVWYGFVPLFSVVVIGAAAALGATAARLIIWLAQPTDP